MSDPRFFPPKNFAALPLKYSDYQKSRVVILPVPYDSTTSGWGGAREGPAAIIDASENMEIFDIVINREPYLFGIHTLPDIAVHSGNPQQMVERIEEVVGEQIDSGKFVATLGGEHTVAVGSVRAHARRYEGLSVLALDAHADLRDTYLDTPYNHACTLRRIAESALVVQVGLRSAEREEIGFLGARTKRHFSPRDFRRAGVEAVLGHLTSEVYVTIDLDAFDPSEMSAVGTPEPGGLRWDEVSDLLEAVSAQRRIVGFDVCELAPSLGPRANAQLAAKLTYRLIGLALGR